MNTAPRIIQKTTRPWALLDYLRDPLGSMRRAAGDLGDVVYFRVPGTNVVQFCWPDHIEQILKHKKYDAKKDLITQTLTDALGQGLLTAEGETWKSHRKLAAPSFQPRVVNGYAEAMVRIAGEHYERELPKSGSRTLDVHAMFMTLTLDVVAETLFGTELDLDRGRVSEVLSTYMHEFHLDTNGWRRLIPKRIPTPGRRRRARTSHELDHLFLGLIADRRNETLGDDLLSRLIAANEDGERFDDRALRDEVVTAFVAGHETTALSLSYACFLLAAHTGVQEALRAELDEVLDGEIPRREDLAKMPLLDAVVKEALRLYPPAYIVGRETQNPCTVAGEDLPAGANLVTPQWVVHVDERWWKEPMAFRPERWTNGETDDLPKFAYFPFGGGPRVCIGSHFAVMETALLLAAMLQRVRLLPEPDFQLQLEPSVTLRPATGVRLQLHT